MHDTCIQADLPLEPSKTQGPVCSITFLGIGLDSMIMKARLPQDKLSDTLEMLAQWQGCTAWELQSLIGVLTHASKVVRSSRIFLHRLINLCTSTKEPDYFIHLNVEARSDIEWWYQFIRQWNGQSMIPLPRLQPFILV